jgi:hydrogenase maturation protease
MGDDGFGLAALARLRDEWTFERVELADGGTWGMSLLPLIEDAERVILLDAIASGGQPGDVVVLEREQLPMYFNRKLSVHQIDLREVLAAAELRGTLPAETVAIGVQPRTVELGYGMSRDVEESVDAAVSVVIARLTQWGHHCTRRTPAESCTR